MPSNAMLVCLDCRVGGKGWYPQCVRDSHRLMSLGKHVTVPRKSNHKAWDKIANGDIFWDDKKVRKDPSRREWHNKNIIHEGKRWVIVAWNSPEWKKRQAERLISIWS